MVGKRRFHLRPSFSLMESVRKNLQMINGNGITTDYFFDTTIFWGSFGWKTFGRFE